MVQYGDDVDDSLAAVAAVAVRLEVRRRAVALVLIFASASVSRPGARFTKYLTIYHKIIVNLSYDRLMIVTYNVLSSFPGISQVSLRTLSQTIARFCK